MRKVIGRIAVTVGILAGLANILTYLEQSSRFPEAMAMISTVVSFEVLRLAINLALIVIVLLAIWRQNILFRLFSEHLAKHDDSHKKEGKGLTAKANQVLYPPGNQVLWEWDEKVGAAGPFCPVHETPLVYKDYMKHVQPSFTEENFLGGTGRFTCLTDDQDFVFYEPPTLRIGELRSQAATLLRAKMTQRNHS